MGTFAKISKTSITKFKNLLNVDTRKSNYSCKLSVRSVVDKSITMVAFVIKALW